MTQSTTSTGAGGGPVQGLPAERLCRRCDFGDLDFQTTEDLEDFSGLLGQPRAVAAVEFGIGIEREGFNIFALGPQGAGKHSAIQQFLEEKAAKAPVPPDICYVNNFQQPHCPRLLLLPAGRGGELRQAMARLIEELGTALEGALESEEYQNRKQGLEQQFEEQQSRALAELGDHAAEKGLALVRTPVGIVFAPVRGEEVLSPEEFQNLPEEEKQRLDREIENFKEKLQKVLQQFARWQRETQDKLSKLNLQVSRYAVGPLFAELRERFSGLEAVQEYLDAAERDVLENAQRLTGRSEPPAQIPLESLMAGQDIEKPLLRRYRVSLLVDHAGTAGAPVVFEDNPSYQNLVGRVEHIPQMGAVVTDFNLIKPGALHQANGGYLLIDALKLLQNPFAWEGLKRALQARSVKIESLGEALSLISTYSLEPQPLELRVKVVMMGHPMVYYLLAAADPDFSELFKVAADFAAELDWTPDTQQLYARLIAKLAREEKLRPFGRQAVARLIEHSARTVGDTRKMSLLMSRMLDLMREADYWAERSGRATVESEDVERAIDAAIFRSDRVREQVQEQILRRTVLVDTEGSQIGQVNGLSVLQLGDFTFGQPSRITARVRLGKGEVVNIEREVELSGPIHSKGVLILAGFLGARYASDCPLSLSASLVFEQSYSGVEGDSASSAELYALLSAISEAPLRQSLAVTGSVNQRGEVQAIGGVNQKIEGFFDICAARGLTGDQGVLIPESNVEHLMLRRDVVEAVDSEQFHIYPIAHVDQGIEILTGLTPGARDPAGRYPADSVNARVAARLEAWARTAREFARPSGNGRSESGERDERST